MSSSSSSTTTSLLLRRATRSDIPHITRILYLNALHFELKDHWVPLRRTYPEEFYAHLLIRMRTLFTRPDARIIVAERTTLGIASEERRVLGFAVWNAEGKGNPIAEQWEGEWPVVGKSVVGRAWHGLERTLGAVEAGYMRYARNRIFDYEAFGRTVGRLHHGFDEMPLHLHLMILMVDPDVHATGVGGRLLRWGMGVADEMGLALTLSSSRRGYPFYLRNGLKVLKWVRVDTNPEHAFDMPLLVYEPKGKEGMWVKESQERPVVATGKEVVVTAEDG